MKKLKSLTKTMKSEKGAITLFVVVLLLFFLIALITNYVGMQNKIREQEKQIKMIQSEYSVTDIDRVYYETVRRVNIEE